MSNKFPISRALVLDIETSVKEQGASPAVFDGESKPILYGWYWIGDGTEQYPVDPLYVHAVTTYTHGFTGWNMDDEPYTFIGHNIKFDLMHMYRHKRAAYDSVMHHKGGCMLWDTSLCHYLLTGQRDKFPSLETACARYPEITLTKSDVLKTNMEAGIMPQDIPTDELRRYLKTDVAVTANLAYHQMHEVMRRGLAPLVFGQMKALYAVIQMECNGMRVDVDRLYGLANALDKQERVLGISLLEHVNAILMRCGIPALTDANQIAMSANFFSPLLFGGTFKWDERVADGVYKTGAKAGTPKYRTEQKSLYIGADAHVGNLPTLEVLENKMYSVSEDQLEAVRGLFYSPPRNDIVDTLLKLRHVQKLKDTFVNGIALSLSRANDDFKIHPSFNQTSTGTGRLSSSKPNLQNIPSFEEDETLSIRKLFVSRFPGGKLIDVDYKQAEIIALAYRSRDPQLLADILTGVDIHAETGKLAYGRPINKEERRVVKTINFGLIYGGSAETLAKQAGVDLDIAEECVAAFYARYPGVKRWAKQRYDQLVTIRPDKIENGICHIIAPDTYDKETTGRTYSMSYPMGGKVSWTQSRNYPLQGLATGDIVPLMMGNLQYWLNSNPRFKDKVLLINQVHDSMLFDAHPDVAEEAAEAIKKFLGTSAEQVSSHYKIDFDLPLKVDMKIGSDWHETSKD